MFFCVQNVILNKAFKEGEYLMNTNRMNYIDVAKGIGIIFVVFAHVNYTPELLVLIYSFHMPLFFLISGMLFNNKKYPEFKGFFLKRVKTLFVPYVIYEIVSIGWLYVSERMYSDIFEVTREEYIEFFRQIIISNWSGTHVNQPLWFVPCLFLVEIIYYFISKMKKVFIIPTCFVLVCGGWILESGMLNFDNKLLPWSLDSALFALGLYAIGNLSSEHVKNIIGKIKNNKYRHIIAAEIFILCACIWYPLTQINGKITLGSKILGNGFLLYINGVLGTIMILIISIYLEKNKVLAFFGKNSFLIMAIHYVIRNYIIKPLYINMNGEIYDRTIAKETIIPFVLVLRLSVLYTLVYNKIKGCVLKIKS